MPKVYIKRGEGLEAALMRFESKVQKDGIIDEYKRRSAFRRKTERKHRKK